MLVKLTRRWLNFLDQFFQQSIVLIGQHLGQSVECMLLGIAELGRNLDALGRLVRAVPVGASAHDFNVADHRIILSDRQLPRRQRVFGTRLERRKRVVERAGQRIDLIHKDKVRDLKVLKRFQQERHAGSTAGHWLADNYGEIDRGQRRFRLKGEFNRTRTIQDRPAITQKGTMSKPRTRC